MTLRLVVAGGIAVLAACAGTSSGSSEDTKVCDPGDQKACACIGGASGIQVCNSQGTAWRQCTGCPGDSSSSGPEASSSAVESSSSSGDEAGSSSGVQAASNASSTPSSSVSPSSSAAGLTSSSMAPNAKRVFISSVKYNGNLGGTAGADAKCNALAEGHELGGAWTAWLSSGSTNAAGRIVGTGPWNLLNGDRVFNNRAGLLSAPLTRIYRNERGSLACPIDSDCYVWTGTVVGGTASGEDCNGWTEAELSLEGTSGNGFFNNGSWTDIATGNSAYRPGCSSNHRLYCFEN